MTQATTLLAATDFSTPARHALERAAPLAQAHPGTHLTLAHVISRSALDNLRRLFGQDAAALEAKLLEQAQCSLNDLAQHLAASHACTIDTVLKQGAALAALVELAEERQADLQVMGARGEHFMRERVLRTSRRPLLAVKQRPHAPYRRILVPVDFSEHSSSDVFIAGRPA